MIQNPPPVGPGNPLGNPTPPETPKPSWRGRILFTLSVGGGLVGTVAAGPIVGLTTLLSGLTITGLTEWCIKSFRQTVEVEPGGLAPTELDRIPLKPVVTVPATIVDNWPHIASACHFFNEVLSEFETYDPQKEMTDAKRHQLRQLLNKRPTTDPYLSWYLREHEHIQPLHQFNAAFAYLEEQCNLVGVDDLEGFNPSKPDLGQLPRLVPGVKPFCNWYGTPVRTQPFRLQTMVNIPPLLQSQLVGRALRTTSYHPDNGYAAYVGALLYHLGGLEDFQRDGVIESIKALMDRPSFQKFALDCFHELDIYYAKTLLNDLEFNHSPEDLDHLLTNRERLQPLINVCKMLTLFTLSQARQLGAENDIYWAFEEPLNDLGTQCLENLIPEVTIRFTPFDQHQAVHGQRLPPLPLDDCNILAYQCYGNPQYAIIINVASPDNQPEQPAATDLNPDLDKLAQYRQTGDFSQTFDLPAYIHQLQDQQGELEQMPPGWVEQLDVFLRGELEKYDDKGKVYGWLNDYLQAMLGRSIVTDGGPFVGFRYQEPLAQTPIGLQHQEIEQHYQHGQLSAEQANRLRCIEDLEECHRATNRCLTAHSNYLKWKFKHLLAETVRRGLISAYDRANLRGLSQGTPDIALVGLQNLLGEQNQLTVELDFIAAVGDQLQQRSREIEQHLPNNEWQRKFRACLNKREYEHAIEMMVEHLPPADFERFTAMSGNS